MKTIVRTSFYDWANSLLEIREQELGPEDKLHNLLRRHAEYAAKRIESEGSKVKRVFIDLVKRGVVDVQFED